MERLLSVVVVNGVFFRNFALLTFVEGQAKHFGSRKISHGLSPLPKKIVVSLQIGIQSTTTSRHHGYHGQSIHFLPTKTASVAIVEQGSSLQSESEKRKMAGGAFLSLAAFLIGECRPVGRASTFRRALWSRPSLVVPFTLTSRAKDQSHFYLSYFREPLCHLYSTTPNHASSAFSSDYHAMEECWKASSTSINPTNDTRIDAILQKLHSPAPQSFYAIQHALGIWSQGTTPFSLEELFLELSYLVKPGYTFVIPESQVRDSQVLDWDIVDSNISYSNGRLMKKIDLNRTEKPVNSNQMAGAILEQIVEDSVERGEITAARMENAVTELNRRLQITLGTDIRGRTSADTAFTLSLAGIKSSSLYDRLVKIAELEMTRVGKRPSRRAKDILHIVEKLAASGVRGDHVQRVYDLAAQSLSMKGEHTDIVEQLSNPGKFGLLQSPRALLWLWRFSSRLPKEKPRSSQSELCGHSHHWFDRLEDPNRQLVVDIGCGLGVSLLGLASLSPDSKSAADSLLGGLNWSECNFFGGDLSNVLIGYGRGIASRWELDERLQYGILSADDLLESLKIYPGRIALLMIQFPTPYKISNKNDGNSQLPESPDDGFMVSSAIVHKISNIVQASGAYLLLQTNCEDVAVTLCDQFSKNGLQVVPSSNPVLLPRDGTGRLPQRTKEWVQLGGARAVGPGWSADPILPDHCATETEAACTIQGTPIHRCLLKS